MILEQMILEHLTGALHVPVCVELPAAGPGAFVFITRTGSARQDHALCRATVALQSYGDSLLQAAELNEQVTDAMERFVESDKVARCRLNSSYAFPDIERRKSRYQAVFEILFYLH